MINVDLYDRNQEIVIISGPVSVKYVRPRSKFVQ